MKKIKRWVDGARDEGRTLIFLNIAEDDDDDFYFYGEGLVVDFNIPPTEEEKGMLRMLYPDNRLAEFIINLPKDFNPEWEIGLGKARNSVNCSSYRSFNPREGYTTISEWGE